MSIHPKVVVATLSAVVLSACSSHQESESASTSTSAPPSAHTLSAELHTADGRLVATANFEFANGYATVTVKTTANDILAPGLHGMHIHEIGKCEPNSPDPMGGAPGACERFAPGIFPSGVTRRGRCAAARLYGWSLDAAVNHVYVLLRKDIALDRESMYSRFRQLTDDF